MSTRKLAQMWIVFLLPVAIAESANGQTRARAGASTAKDELAARFADPVVLQAGDRAMGAERLYPSPVFRDMNEDGHLDIVLGDLWGNFTIALRVEGDGVPRFAADEPVLGRDAKPLDFQNW